MTDRLQPRPGPEYVFGYGSLVDVPNADTGGDARVKPEPTACDLYGYRRTWNVAMENANTIPGYKYYVDPNTGMRPGVVVVFLNIVPDPETRVNGVTFAVSPEVLARLDQRERNYERIDVSSRVSPRPAGRVWAYAGSTTAVRRFENGQVANRGVISRDYYQGVLDDFARLGAAAMSAFVELTDPTPCPIVSLRRINLPPVQTSAQTRST